MIERVECISERIHKTRDKLENQDHVAGIRRTAVVDIGVADALRRDNCLRILCDQPRKQHSIGDIDDAAEIDITAKLRSGCCRRFCYVVVAAAVVVATVVVVVSVVVAAVVVVTGAAAAVTVPDTL